MILIFNKLPIYQTNINMDVDQKGQVSKGKSKTAAKKDVSIRF